MIDAWILINKTALPALWAAAHPTPSSDPQVPTTPIPDNVRLLSIAVRGYWKDTATHAVVNVLAPAADIEAFRAANAVNVGDIYGWTQGDGLDNLDSQGVDANGDPITIGYPTIPQGVLDVMNDHVTYDDQGNETSRTAATFANPNWGHVFLGQKQRIFAGSFSNGFSRGFR